MAHKRGVFGLDETRNEAGTESFGQRNGELLPYTDRQLVFGIAGIGKRGLFEAAQIKIVREGEDFRSPVLLKFNVVGAFG